MILLFCIFSLTLVAETRHLHFAGKTQVFDNLSISSTSNNIEKYSKNDLANGQVPSEISNPMWNTSRDTSNILDSLRTTISNTSNEHFTTSKPRNFMNDKDKSKWTHDIRELIKLWLILYIVVAIPLWCTKGWCCCCLFCKFFKPDKTIEEAKKFLELNPPGVYHHRGVIILYEPSEMEKECYEKFEHSIRTI